MRPILSTSKPFTLIVFDLLGKVGDLEQAAKVLKNGHRKKLEPAKLK
jgi:hypothetical protein